MKRGKFSEEQIKRSFERGEMTTLEAIDVLLAEEFTPRQNRRIKAALVMARLSTIKTLAGFDFSLQPSLDKNRIMALAELKFIDASRSCTWSGLPAPAKVTSARPSASKLSRLGAVSTLLPSPKLFGNLPRPSVMATCVRRSGSSAASRS
jgi:DNA replication protein DnaC